MRLPHRIQLVDFANPRFREGAKVPDTPIATSWLDANIVAFNGVTIDCLVTFEGAEDVSQQTPSPLPRFYVGQRRYFALVRNQSTFNVTTSFALYNEAVDAFREMRMEQVNNNGWTINRNILFSSIANMVFASDHVWASELGAFPDPNSRVNAFTRDAIGRARQIAGYGQTNVRGPEFGRGVEVAVISQAGPNTLLKMELSYDRL